MSQYKWEEFRAMHANGSPFIAHLNLEGKVIGGNGTGIDRYQQLLRRIPPYRRGREDVQSFELSLTDVRSAIRLQDSTPEFELAAIATTIRHAAILGCYLLGDPRFGRHTAVQHFCHRMQLPPEISEEFPELYTYRMSLARLRPWPVGASFAMSRRWVERADILVREVSRLAV
ncbi:hypothetical protein O7631_02160 [Micromonospora sp. WMMD967]|uniref:hypothetical protein n=1 Tax=Micromonospora sp. WMMD967 TaxID=3016101 RepID=UPI0024163781|nr:hypothetical protein [Micromonospora sp. WMMD967]MDG4835317.1 hypothetical protein [Micromonospora sp. WMMD967]